MPVVKSMSETRENLSDIGNEVAFGGARVVVVRRGKQLFALVPMDDLELLEQLEDRMDLEVARKRLKGPRRDFEEFARQLGL